jgi:soluble lytic murein transglycosylase-like protein
MSILSLALSAAVAASAQPVPAGDPLAPLPQVQVPPPSAQPAVQPEAQTQVPPPPPRAIVIPRDWREVFAAIRAGDWGSAQAGIAVLPDDVLAPVAKAELYTAKGSPPVDLPRIQSLLAQGPDLPDADQLARLAAARGSTTPMAIIPERPTAGLGAGPRRYRPKPVGAEPLADALRAQIDGFVKADDAPNAEAALIAQAPYLSADARTEAAQRIAWIYYTNGDDLNARRVADTWRAGASGEWGSQAAWASGLASWRMGDCNAAARAFREVAATAPQRELSAGGYYCAARSEQACRRPQSVEPLLKAAAASPESFYGLVARETLGTSTRLPPPAPISTASVETLPNVRRAKALAAIGETGLAEELLRHQARIGAPADHAALLEMARRLNLAGAQYWLATNGQRGVRVQAAYRYPRPEWTPIRGWRVDPALAFAHIIQESNFRPGAVSSAGAVGLMQVLPSTAAAIADQDGLGYSRENLFSPTLNLEYGQSFIERMRRSANTGGQLPKVIASYNAGPLPVGRWAAIRDKGDPVLWIESIPYWETRYYVPAVMRNLWVYEGLEGDDQSSLKAIAQHRWPAFPARSGALQR